MPSPGKSLQKGLLRLGGTIPGCIAAIVILALAVYVFILPRLTTFPELAAVIFTLVFINLMVNTGIAQFAGNIAIINLIAIQNHQIYVFAPLVNVSPTFEWIRLAQRIPARVHLDEVP
jgi:uncharacterized membrane protein YccC